ncbi:MAG TPA: hypothetical protein PKJ68_04585 [Candidatus Woesebacteria bacterium]|nr:hypothetical protein [Candidatus Woesebacteria bacterium]
MATLTESELIDIIYSKKEGDNTTWGSTDSEYLTARRLLNAGVYRWEFLEGTRWKELYKKLSSASDGTKTCTAGDYDVSCPTDMRLAPEKGTYVRVGSEDVPVISVHEVEQYRDEGSSYCYFTGNDKDGFTLNFNPNMTLTTGATIDYMYYKSATKFTGTTSTTEMRNPMFLVHYVLADLYQQDESGSPDKNISETMLAEMKADNFEVIGDALDNHGFGI